MKPLRTLTWIVIAAAALAAALWYMTAMPGQSWRAPLEPLTAEEAALAPKLRAHVEAIGQAPRNTAAYAALQAGAAYIEQQLAGLGYRVGSQRFTAGGLDVRNLEVEIAGAREPAAIVVVGAHYDSAGSAAGANDNGSGVAAVIELARHFRDRQPARTLRFVLFVNEEMPWFKSDGMGSFRYARRAAERGERIVAMLSIETIGYYSDRPGSQRYPAFLGLLYPSAGNFIGFVGDLGARPLVHQAIAAFRRRARFPSEGIAAPASIPGVDWSDHWAFSHHGFPAIMITDTAPYRYPHYHRPSDTPDKVDYERAARVVRGLAAVVDALAGPAD